MVLLFLCEMRSTYVLQAAQRTLRMAPPRKWKSFGMLVSLEMLADKIHNLSERTKHLRLWAQHWFRKLYDDEVGRPQFLFLAYCTALSSMDVDPDSPIPVDRDMVEEEGEEEEGEEEDCQFLLGCQILKLVAKSLFGPDKWRALGRELDILACRDLVGLPFSRFPGLVEEGCVVCSWKMINAGSSEGLARSNHWLSKLPADKTEHEAYHFYCLAKGLISKTFAR